MSELALQLIEENKKTKATRLDLGNCGLTELPEELFECVWLEELTLSNEWVSTDIDFFLYFKSWNNGEPNKIEKISHSFCKLEKLKSLNLSGGYNDPWPISDFSFLESTPNLKHLNIANTLTKDITFVSMLEELRSLIIDSTKVIDIQELANLKKIRNFSCCNTNIRNLTPLNSLIDLQFLEASGTLVEDIAAIKDLSNLILLDLSSTNIEQIDHLQKLLNLEVLLIGGTKVSDLEIIRELRKIKRLDVNKTFIKDIAPLSALRNLQSLSLERTIVTDILPIRFMIENGIEIILNERLQYSEMAICINDTFLDPALIAAIKSGKEAILKYLDKPKERLWEARVLILGEPRAGKTTLRRKLKSTDAIMPSTNESTKGIEIDIETRKCKLRRNDEVIQMQYHLWDFGGQDMYRLLHQLFITEQSVYVIVTDTDKNKNEEEIDFWLETIQRLGRGKDGKYGPVILFQNPKTDREGNGFLELKKRYQDLWKQSEDFTINLDKISKGRVNFDKQEFNRFKRFKDYLEKSFYQLEHIGQEMPRQWIRIRKALNKLVGENWITLEHFRKICENQNIFESKEQEDLLKIFHILGYVLHYNTGQLRGMVILNKEWATDALYRVLDDEIVRRNKGWFIKEDAKQIWHDKKYQDRENELLLLMQEFRLCYFNERSKKYIVPSKLPEDEEGLPQWNDENNVRLFLSYDWLPRSIATQLIVLLHEHIVQLNDREQWIWRKGAVLNGIKLGIDDAQVMILDNWKERRIEIHAQGTYSEQIIKVLMQQWRVVHEPYEKKVQVSKIIICNCEKCKTLEKPFEFDYQEVLDAYSAGDSLKCNKSRIELGAMHILRGVFDSDTANVDSLISKNGDSEILRLISNDKLEEAIDLLPSEDEMIISLKADMARLRKSFIISDVLPMEYNHERSRITNNILRYIGLERRYTYSTKMWIIE